MVSSLTALFPGSPALHQPLTQESARKTFKKRVEQPKRHCLSLGQEKHLSGTAGSGENCWDRAKGDGYNRKTEDSDQREGRNC